MSTLLKKMFEDFFGGKTRLTIRRQICCALCRGELYPGEYYYLLEGRRVCETCLERFAQQYFSNQRRRLSPSEKEER